jgi:hypothetical protein
LAARVVTSCVTVLLVDGVVVPLVEPLLPELPVAVPAVPVVDVVVLGVGVAAAVVLPDDPPPQAANSVEQARVMVVNFVGAKVRTADNMISGAGSLQ